MENKATPRTWLKNIRVEKGLTQQEVASSGDFARTYYTMVEQGKRKPSVDIAKSIAKVLGFKWTIFFEDECNELKHIDVKNVTIRNKTA